MQKDIAPSQRQLLNLKTFLEEYNISRSQFYIEVKEERLRVTRVNNTNRVYIKRIDAEIWLNNLTVESD